MKKPDAKVKIESLLHQAYKDQIALK